MRQPIKKIIKYKKVWVREVIFQPELEQTIKRLQRRNKPNRTIRHGYYDDMFIENKYVVIVEEYMSYGRAMYLDRYLRNRKK